MRKREYWSKLNKCNGCILHYMPFHHKRYVTYCTSRNKQDYQSRVQFHFGFVPTTKYIFFLCFACIYIRRNYAYTYIHIHKNIHAQTHIHVQQYQARCEMCRDAATLYLRYRVWDFFCYTNHKFSRKRYFSLFLHFF